MITTLSILSAIIYIAISWYVGNKMQDTFYFDWEVQFMSTVLGLFVISGTIAGLVIIAIGFYKLWSYLL